MSETVVPWGVTRMRPYPDVAELPAAGVTLDPVTQTGKWVDRHGNALPATARHKRSETSKETQHITSLDGKPDQGHDQQGDTD
ncbi:putative ATP-grasp-modified RiPP [Streptomyces sp. NPDC002454]|uniref:putative ATP-grasp-modified RiPP n=1 Tax=Streptomyces sp. NPDC002490 TaxID=3154416 RepID=UPI00332E12D2